jgi:arginine deiminase
VVLNPESEWRPRRFGLPVGRDLGPWDPEPIDATLMLMSTSAVPVVGERVHDAEQAPTVDAVLPCPRPRPGVHSEAGVLRTALLDVGTRGQLVGDRAASAVAEVLRQRGVGVVALRDLLADLLGAAEARRALVERVVDVVGLAPLAARRVERMLLGAEPAAAAKMLLDGLPVRDFDLGRSASPRGRFLLQPLARSRSLRSAWVLVGATMLPALPPAAQPDARRAVAIATSLCRFHPTLRALRPIRYLHDPALRRSDTQVDGDDVLLAPDGSLLVGIGHRTTAHGARQLARTLLDIGAVSRVTVLTLSPGARFDRLDDLLVPVDRDLTIVHPAAFAGDLPTWTLSGGRDGAPLRVVAGGPFREVAGALLGRAVTLTDIAGAAGPEHFLPLEPGTLLTTVPASDPTVRLLEQLGLEVLSVPGASGPVGGVRRMVQPLSRDPVRVD